MVCEYFIPAGGVKPRCELYSSHKIPVEARANMRNHLGPYGACLLEGGRRNEAPRGGGNKMARVLLTASQGPGVAIRGRGYFPPAEQKCREGLLPRQQYQVEIGRFCYPDCQD